MNSLYDFTVLLVTIYTAFFIKHFIADFLLQSPYQYLNKGRYLHLGGILHATIHGVFTALLCRYFHLPPILGLVDAILHYHIDYFKVRLNKYYELTATNGQGFWFLLGLDQFLHCLTYSAIILVGFNKLIVP